MTVNELIKIIGNIIVCVDVIRSGLDRNTPERVRLDNDRDDLDTYQRKIVRSVIDDNTAEFRKYTTSLKEADAELAKTINDIKKLAETLAALNRFVTAAGKIAALAG